MDVEKLFFLSKEEAEFLRCHLFNLEKFEVKIKQNWNSQEAQHREEIQKDLDNQIFLQTKDSFYLDSSKSHCPLVGGYAYARGKRSFQIGFDIEVKNRISSKVIERVCSEKELSLFKDQRALWSAKEAAFKALKGPYQPRTISDLFLEPLISEDSDFISKNSMFQFETFSISNKISSNFDKKVGCLKTMEDIFLSVFIIFN